MLYIFKFKITLSPMINPMIYRVFLQDEADAPDPIENPENYFRIRNLRMLSWCYSKPRWKPTLEQQLKSADYGTRVGPSSEKIDGHWLIQHDGATMGVVHDTKEIPEKAYQLAKQEAQRLADYLSKKEGKLFVLIDVTLGGDKQLAKNLATRLHREHVPDSCLSGNPALCADIGD